MTSSACVLSSFDAKAAGSSTVTFKTDWGYFTTQPIVNVPGGLIGGSDLADADNDGEVELVAGSGGNNFNLIRFDGTSRSWKLQTVPTVGNGILGVCADEVNSTNPGNELLIGGFSGKVMEYHFIGSDYNMTTIYDVGSEIWNIDAGDIIPDMPGKEIAMAHSSKNISVLYRNDGKWECMTLNVAAPTRTLEIGEFDSANPGLELATGSEEGDLEEFYWAGAAFEHRLVNKGDRAIRNVGIGDYCSLSPGNELIEITYSFGAGNASMIYNDAGTWKTRPLYNSTRGLEALALGDFNPLHPGIEPVFAGYSNRVTMVVDDTKTTTSVDIYEVETVTTSELVAVAVGDIYPMNRGHEVYIMGYNGTIWMSSYEYPGVDLEIPVTEGYEMEVGEDMTLTAKAVSKGGYDGDVEVIADLLVKDPVLGYVAVEEDSGISVEYIRTAAVADEVPATINFKVISTDMAVAGDYKLLLDIVSPLDPTINDTGHMLFKAEKSSIVRSVRVESFTAVMEGKGYNVTAVVTNTGNVELRDMRIVFYLNDVAKQERDVAALAPDGSVYHYFHIDVPEGNNSLRVEIEGLPADTLISKPSAPLYLENEKAGTDKDMGVVVTVIIFILVLIVIITIVGILLYLNAQKKRREEEEEADPRGRKRPGAPGRGGRQSGPANKRGADARSRPSQGSRRQGPQGGRRPGWR